MTQTESYDLQTQRMVAAQQNNGKIFGRFDPIHIGLAVISIIFLILSIVFIILFATKHGELNILNSFKKILRFLGYVRFLGYIYKDFRTVGVDLF